MQVFNHKHRCGACIAFSKGMYLPQVGSEFGNVSNGLIEVMCFVIIAPFTLKIVLKGLADVVSPCV